MIFDDSLIDRTCKLTLDTLFRRSYLSSKQLQLRGGLSIWTTDLSGALRSRWDNYGTFVYSGRHIDQTGKGRREKRLRSCDMIHVDTSSLGITI